MSIENSDGFKKYVYTASNDNSSLKSKTVVQNNYDSKKVIENILEDLKKLSFSKDPYEIKNWIEQTISKLEILLKEETNKKKHAALSRLINNIQTS
jgi:hypothetical protein